MRILYNILGILGHFLLGEKGSDVIVNLLLPVGAALIGGCVVKMTVVQWRGLCLFALFVLFLLGHTSLGEK